MKALPFSFFLLIAIALFSCKDEKKQAAGIQTIPFLQDTGSSAPNAASLYAGVDVSPMDMCYFPVDYPKIKMTNSATPDPVARVIYSRPHLQNRHLFRDLLKYDQPWRLGANEATEIDLYQPVKIQGKTIQPGRFILYCIPHAENWTIVFNTNIDSWGLQQDTAKDAYRFTASVKTVDYSQEYFTMLFEKSGKGADLIISWDNFLVTLPLEF